MTRPAQLDSPLVARGFGYADFDTSQGWTDPEIPVVVREPG